MRKFGINFSLLPRAAEMLKQLELLMHKSRRAKNDLVTMLKTLTAKFDMTLVNSLGLQLGELVEAAA